MPLGAEEGWDDWAWAYNEGRVTNTWDLDFPPSQGFIKVVMGHYTDFGGSPMVQIGLVNIHRRKPDNSDETVVFPSLDAFDHVYMMFDSMMTHVTMGLNVQDCSSSLVWWLGFWG